LVWDKMHNEEGEPIGVVADYGHRVHIPMDARWENAFLTRFI